MRCSCERGVIRVGQLESAESAEELRSERGSLIALPKSRENDCDSGGGVVEFHGCQP